MFLSRIFIGPGGVGQVYEDILKQNLATVANEFSQFHPYVEASNHFVEFKNVDRDVLGRIKQFIIEQDYEFDPESDVVIEELHTDSELFGAEYVPLTLEGDYIDADRHAKPLNRFPKVQCRDCLWAEEAAVPNPYVVSEDNIRKVQDIYRAHNGIVILSQRFMSALGDRLAGCIQTGKVVVKSRSKAKRLKGPYVWLRPTFALGKEIRAETQRTCATCGAPTEIRRVTTGDIFLDAQVILEHFGNRKYDISLSGNWYGGRTRKHPMCVGRTLFISGQLCSFLLSQKLKGLCRPSHIVRSRK